MRQAGNCRYERDGRASGRCGQVGQPGIRRSECRGMCEADGERSERAVGHPVNKMDWGGKRAKDWRGEYPMDLGEYAKGSGGAGRRKWLVGGFGRKRSRRGTGNVLPASPSSSIPPHKLCSSPSTARALWVFCRIRRTKSGQNGASWEEGWRSTVGGRGWVVDKSRPPGACEQEPAGRGIQG